jgi:hypothetical protein
MLSVSPQVLSINRATPTTALTNASSVNYTVTFNEPVTGVDTTDFHLAETGGVTAVVSQVTPVSGSVYTVTVSNITGNGTLGLNLVNDGSIHDLVGNTLVGGSASFQHLQSPAFQTSGALLSLAAADFNGDGKPDLLVNYYATGGTTSVLLGNGDGTFQNPTSVAPALGLVRVADVNGDGHPDIIQADYNSSSVSVFLGNGNGGFQQPQPYPTSGRHLRYMAVADLNGDGKPDIVTANNGGYSVNVLLNNGDGTFKAAQTLSVGGSFDFLAVADVNGDGKPDLVVGAGSSVIVLQGNGDGTFQNPQTVSTIGPSALVAVADVNGDGKPDLVVNEFTPYSQSYLGVMLGNGDGTFQNQTSIGTLAGDFTTVQGSVVVADVNGDGKPDIIAANYGRQGVSVFLGNGDGTFQSPQLFATNTSTQPASITVADLNADGKPDIIIQNYHNADVLLNTVDGSFTGQVYTIDQTPPFVQSIILQTTTNTIITASSVSFTVTFSEPVTGVDSTDIQPAVTGTVAAALTQVTTVSSTVYTVTVSGITGDGTLGLNVLPNGNIRDLADNAFLQGNFTPAAYLAPQTYSAGGQGPTYGVAVADVNGDGKLDIVTTTYGYGRRANYVLLGNGDGTVQSAQPVNATNSYNSVVIADLNGDGKPDMVTANPDGTVSVFLGTVPVYTIEISTPTAHIVADPNATQAPDKVSLLLTATDTLSQALAAGFSYSIDWGDGTAPQTIIAAANNANGVPVSHTYTTYGSYLVSVTATDTYGAVSSAATGLVAVSTQAGDNIVVWQGKVNVSKGLSPVPAVSISMMGRKAVSYSPTDLVLVNGQGGNDAFTVNFDTALTTAPILLVGTNSAGDTLTAYGSNDPSVSNYIVKNATTQTITWGLAANQVAESAGYAGISAINIIGGAGTNYITDPGTKTTITGGPGANFITITATTGSGVVINGGTGTNTYIVDLGSLAGPVTIQNSNSSATNNLIVNGAPGDNTIAAAGNQIAAGTQTITDTASLMNLTINGGSGTNQLTVSALSVPVQNITLAGGSGTTTYTVNAGTVNIVAGTGVNNLIVSGGTVASITAPAGDTKPLVFAHSYTVLDNGTLGVPANGVLASDVSANGKALSAVLASGPAHGTVSLNTDGSFTYTPAANFVGSDSFMYQAKGSDGTLSTAAPVTILVTYRFSGLLAPLNSNMALALNRTVPIKFQLTDFNNKYISSLSAVASLQVLNSSGTNVLTNSGSTALRYDSTAYQFIANWNTKGLPAGTYMVTLVLADGTTYTKAVTLSKTGSASGLTTTAAGGTGSAVGALLGGDIDLYVDNTNGDLTADELARIQDAVTAVDAVTEPYGVAVQEVTDPTLADVTLNMDTTSAVGSFTDGVLGCTTDAGQITILAGWSFYAGGDASQIGSAQYDFQTVVTHELGHALGLGHSTDATSVMYATLSTGTVNRSLTTADLNVPDSDTTGACGLHAVLAAAQGGEASVLATTSPALHTVVAGPVADIGSAGVVASALRVGAPDAPPARTPAADSAGVLSPVLDSFLHPVSTVASQPAALFRAAVATSGSGAADDAQEPDGNSSRPDNGVIPTGPAANPPLIEQAIDALLARVDAAQERPLPVSGTPSAAAVESVFAADAPGNLPPVQPPVHGHRSGAAELAAVDVGWAWVGVLGLLLNTEVQDRRTLRARGRITLAP